MIGWTLGRYFFMRYAIITGWFFIGVAALVYIVTFTELSGRSSGLAEFTAAWALTVSAFQLPMIMQQAVPFIGLVAGIVTLTSLNRKYELVVARAAGISAWQFLTPICFGAFAFGLFALLVLNPLAASGFQLAESMEAEIRGAKATAASDSPWLKQRTEAEGETIIGAQSVLEQGLELANATFMRFDDEGAISERLDARRAHLRDGYWELVDVERLRPGEAPQPVDRIDVATNLEPEFVSEQLTRPEMINVFELPRKIAAARSFGLSANGFATHLHTQLALPAMLVAMTLIAATVSMRFARMGHSAIIIVGGILAGFLLYVVSVLVKAFGTAGFVPPAAAAWFPVLIAFFFGVTFLLYREDG